jgi:site-specific recombinase XerD
MFLRQRGKFWYYQFDYEGTRYEGSTRLTKRPEAQRFLDQLRSDVILGKASRSRWTVGAVAERWFDNHVVKTRSAKTTAYRLDILFRHLPRDTLIEKLSTSDVEAAVQRRSKDHSRAGKPVTPSTVNRDMIDTTLRPILSYADEVMELKVPTIRWKRLRQAEPEGRTRTFTQEELAAWRAELPAWHRPVFDFITTYGVRLREAFFAPGNVQPATLTVRIRAGDRKNSRELLVAVTQEDMAVLAPLAARAAALGLSTIWMRDKGPIHWRGFQSASSAALRRAGIEDARAVHDLRHHAATVLLAETGNLALVQRALGHENIQSTTRYAHTSLDDVRKGFSGAAATRTTQRLEEDKESKALGYTARGT